MKFSSGIETDEENTKKEKMKKRNKIDESSLRLA